MTKSKQELKSKTAEKAKPRETYILRSGSHSMKVNGIATKYECGDEVKLTDAELEKFPLKFLSLEEYEGLIAEDERRKRADRVLSRAQFPPRVLKKGQRSSEALKRQRRLLKIQHGNRRVTYM